jgi:hypothetical protein
MMRHGYLGQVEEWQLNSLPQKQPHAKPFSRIINHNNNPNAGMKLHDYKKCLLLYLHPCMRLVSLLLCLPW